MAIQTNITFRGLHKWMAIVIFIPIIFVIVTGIILQVRKPVDAIQPNIYFGVARYQPTASLDMILEAVKAIPEMKVEGWDDIKLYDLRPKHGVVKVRNFAEVEAQIDAKTAQILNVGQRWNDIITLMHEGTTWGLRFNVFLWISIVWLVMVICGLYLLVIETKNVLLGRNRRRAADFQMAANGVATLAPGKAPRPFNLLAFCHKYHYVLGRCMDNIFIERLWRSLKYEAVYLHELTDGFKAERVIDEWIGFYNTERPHSALAGQTPAEAYGIGRPVDMMDKARALPTSPQAQQRQQDVINRILAA